MPEPALPPLTVAPLFRPLSGHLSSLLKSLGPDEWHRPTSSSRRNVKDVASHLLDGSLRRLSAQRDGYFSPDPDSRPRDGEPLTAFLNRLNDDWDQATRRLSPQVLIGLIEGADHDLADLFESLDPHALAPFPVAWAGERESANWMDLAREYTEKWHHTQQIFEATGRPSTITARPLFHPCIDAFLRALPHTYATVGASAGDSLMIDVTGEAGGRWCLVRGEERWTLSAAPAGNERSRVTLDGLTLWRLVTKRRPRVVAEREFPDVRIDGDASLGGHFFGTLAMMA